MKLLLDENLPHDLRHHVTGHEAFTVAYIGWAGTKNGTLLQLAAGGGFDALLTMDNGVVYQQNAATLPVAVVILQAPSNDMSELLPLVPALLAVLGRLAPRSIVRVP